MKNLKSIYKKIESRKSQDLDWNNFITQLRIEPTIIIRDIFKYTSDLLNEYVGQGVDEYPSDTESINYLYYDMSNLFERTHEPFFSDRLFANRFMNIFSNLSHSGQNKIYVVKGPAGSGKSTFLNNLLKSFEDYCHTDNGKLYSIIWKIDKSKILGEDYNKTVEIPCPSNDNPILLIPVEQRKEFLENILDDKSKDIIFNDKSYEWIFYKEPCAICNSIFQTLLDKLETPEEVFEMIFAKRFVFSKKMGTGLTIYNPSDEIPKTKIKTNRKIQDELDELFSDRLVEYKYSEFARVNNGVYGLMDIMENNDTRFNYLHGLVSENLHRIDDIEEETNSIFLVASNKFDNEKHSFMDRVQQVDINYILDVNTQLKVYKSKFGEETFKHFLPEVLENFARLVIASRLNTKNLIKEHWITKSEKYRKYCDLNLDLLKIEIYGGNIPQWLDEEDRKNFDMKTRKIIIDGAKQEGKDGFSERESINLMWDFLNRYTKENELVTIDKIVDFFRKLETNYNITSVLSESIEKLYGYTILQQIKECLYYYNVEKITEDILDYLCSLNYEIDETIFCKSTGNTFKLTNEFLQQKEKYLLKNASDKEIEEFRSRNLKRYISETLRSNSNICESEQFKELYNRYVYNLKSKSLQPFINNETFRQAIKDFGTNQFDSYDDNIKRNVQFLIENLQEKYDYTMDGAKYICVYVIDNKIAEKFSGELTSKDKEMEEELEESMSGIS